MCVLGGPLPLLVGALHREQVAELTQEGGVDALQLVVAQVVGQ